MALGTTADHLSPQAGLIEGRKQRGQGEGLVWQEGYSQHNPSKLPPPLPQSGDSARYV